MVPTIQVHTAAIDTAMNTGHILATEIADYLSLKGVPFREAHEIVGKMVSHADGKGVQVHELSLTDYQSFSKAVESDIQDRLSFKAAIDQKDGIGGTSHQQVQERLKKMKEEFQW